MPQRRADDAPKLVERPAEHHFAIGLNGQSVHVTVCSGVERRVSRAVGIEPRETASRHRARAAAAEHREVAADENLPVGLQAEGVDEPIGAGVEGGVHRAVGIEPADFRSRGCSRSSAESGEVAADQDLAVGLNRHRDHVQIGAGIEPRVDGAVGIQAPDAIARRVAKLAAEMCKQPAEQNLPVRLHGDRIHRAVGARRETRVCRAVGVQPAEVIAHRPSQARVESAAHQNLAVRLDRQRVNVVVHVRARVVAHIDAAVGIEPGEVLARRGAGAAADAAEVAANHDPAIRLDDDGVHRSVDARVEGRIERPVCIEPGETIANRR